MTGLLEKLRNAYSEYRKLVAIYPDTPSVARRMFVTNGFDGLLAALGVNVGGFRPTIDPLFMILSIMGGALSMGILSGVIGVYLSERAERSKEIAKLEKKVARSLKGSIYWRSARIIPFYIALWSGVGVLAFPTLTVIPYAIAVYGIIGLQTAYYLSLAIAIALSGGLGYYLGVVSGENKIIYTARGLGLSMAAILIVSIFKAALGVSPLG